MRSICLIILLIISVGKGWTQSPYSFGVGLQPGFLFPHSRSVDNLRGHTFWTSIHAEKHSNFNQWANNYHQPVVGIALAYHRLGNPQNLGAAYSANVYFESGIFHSPWRLHFGAGVGYIEKVFDPLENPSQTAISTRFNAAFQLYIMRRLWDGEKFNHTLGIGISHYSNGSLKQPNLGVNLPALFWRTSFSTQKQKELLKPEPKQIDPGKFQVMVGYGFKRLVPGVDQSFNIFSLHGIYRYQIKNTQHIRGGFVVARDLTYQFLKDPYAPVPHTQLNEVLEAGINVGYSWNLGNVGLFIDNGFYLYKPTKTKEDMYQFLGLEYYIAKHFMLQTALKIHGGVADYFELGGGVRF